MRQWLGQMFVGGLPLLMGAFIVLLSLDIIPSDETAFHAPRWVAAVAGAVFMVAGMAVIWQSSFKHLQETAWYKVVSHILVGSIFLSFALVFNWVAFGPGEREFSGSISITFVSVEGLVSNALSGRIFFGLFALLLDVGVIYALYLYLKKLWKWAMTEE